MCKKLLIPVSILFFAVVGGEYVSASDVINYLFNNNSENVEDSYSASYSAASSVASSSSASSTSSSSIFSFFFPSLSPLTPSSSFRVEDKLSGRLFKDVKLLDIVAKLMKVKAIALSKQGYNPQEHNKQKFLECLGDVSVYNECGNYKVILAMDGGGIRGVVSMTILMVLKKVLGIELHKLFDLVAGTSVGGIISAILVSSIDGEKRVISLEQAYEIFMDGGATKLFSKRRVKNIIDIMAKEAKLGPKVQSLYETSNLVNLLSPLREARLSKSLSAVMFTTVNEKTLDDFTIKSWKASMPNGMDFSMLDLACATATVKPYFVVREIKTINNGEGREQKTFFLSDGGVHDVSPARTAYESLRKHTKQPEKIILLSLGTGTRVNPDTGESGFRLDDQGIINVLNNLAPDIMDICSNKAHKKLLKYNGIKPEVNYFRLNPFLKVAKSAVDDASPDNLKALQQDTVDFIKNNLHVFCKLVYVLVRVNASKFS